MVEILAKFQKSSLTAETHSLRLNNDLVLAVRIWQKLKETVTAKKFRRTAGKNPNFSREKTHETNLDITFGSSRTLYILPFLYMWGQVWKTKGRKSIVEEAGSLGSSMM